MGLESESLVRVVDPSFTVDEFCKADSISRAMLYRACREGNGPRFYLNCTHRRLTADARRDWQHQREAAAIANGEIPDS